MEQKLTERIIGCAMRVHNVLGSGFLEKVYENAMVLELRADRLEVEQQKPAPVHYKNALVGEYFVDLIVAGKVLVELKSISAFANEHTAVCLNYLRATNLPVCLFINFGKLRLEWKRLAGDSYINSPEVL